MALWHASRLLNQSLCVWTWTGFLLTLFDIFDSDIFSTVPHRFWFAWSEIESFCEYTCHEGPWLDAMCSKCQSDFWHVSALNRKILTAIIKEKFLLQTVGIITRARTMPLKETFSVFNSLITFLPYTLAFKLPHREREKYGMTAIFTNVSSLFMFN